MIEFILYLLAFCGLGAFSYLAAYFYARYEHHRRMLRYQRPESWG